MRFQKKLVKVIPVATEIHINWDCTADVNRVYYTIEGVTKKHSNNWSTQHCMDKIKKNYAQKKKE